VTGDRSRAPVWPLARPGSRVRSVVEGGSARARGKRTEETGSRPTRSSATCAESELNSKAGSLTPPTGTARPAAKGGRVGGSRRRGRPPEA